MINQSNHESKRSSPEGIFERRPPSAIYIEQAIVENIHLDNEATRMRIYQELMHSDILVALNSSDINSSVIKQAEVPVAIITSSVGINYAAIFSSVEACRHWQPSAQYATMRGQELLRLLAASPAEYIVLNPGSSHYIVLQKRECAQLGRGEIPDSSRSPVLSSKKSLSQLKNLQIEFPENILNEKQVEKIRQTLNTMSFLCAALPGAVLPSGCGGEGAIWKRVLFVKSVGLEQDIPTLLGYCESLHTHLMENEDPSQFELGIMMHLSEANHWFLWFPNLSVEECAMPDVAFWEVMKERGFLIHEKESSPLAKNDKA